MVQGTCFKIYRQTKFHPHRTTSGEDMTSYWFSRWQPWWLSTTSGFISNVVTLPKARIYLQTKYRRYTSINGWDIATSSFGKQTSTILEFFSPLWFRPYRSNRHAILHHSTNFNPNRSARGRDMTSYPFLKILLLVSQLSMSLLQKIKFYHQTKCRRYSSIHGWNITSSILEKETSAILEFYFLFQFWLYYHNWHVILHQPAKYNLYRTTHCGNIALYRYFEMAAAAAQYYFRFRVC